jgi:hypothetical protein
MEEMEGEMEAIEWKYVCECVENKQTKESNL